jgi:hypothetical protein
MHDKHDLGLHRPGDHRRLQFLQAATLIVAGLGALG